MAYKWIESSGTDNKINVTYRLGGQYGSGVRNSFMYVGFSIGYDPTNGKKVGIAPWVHNAMYLSGNGMIEDSRINPLVAKIYIDNSLVDTISITSPQYSRSQTTSGTSITNYYYGYWNSATGYSVDYYTPSNNSSTPKKLYDVSLAEHTYKVEFSITGGTYTGTFTGNVTMNAQTDSYAIVTGDSSCALGSTFHFNLDGTDDSSLSWVASLRTNTSSSALLVYFKIWNDDTDPITGMPFNGTFEYSVSADVVSKIRQKYPTSTTIPMALECATYYTDSGGTKTLLGINVHTFNLTMPTVSFTLPSSAMPVGSPASTTITSGALASKTGVRYYLTAENGAIDVTYWTSTGAKTFTPNGSDFGSVIPEAFSGQFAFELAAYVGERSDNTFICKATKTGTVSIPSSPPTPNASVTDLSGLYSQVGKYVIGKSYLSVTVDGGVKNGATVATCSSGINGTYYTELEFITDPITGATSLVISVTDSRGQTGTRTISIPTVVWWIPEIPTFSVHRGYYSSGVWTADDNGNWVKVDYAISVAPVENGNTVSVKITTPDGDKMPTIPSGTSKYTLSGSVYSSANTEYSYTITIAVTDKYATGSRSTTLSTAGVIMDFKAGGKGIGLGKVAETDYMFDISPDWILRLKQMHVLVSSGSTVTEYTLENYIKYVARIALLEVLEEMGI